MIAAWSLEEIVATLTQAFNGRYSDDTIRLVGLLFAPPDSNLGNSEIIKSLDYFHHRSGDAIDFYCAGYRRYGEGRQPVVEREVSAGSDPWIFNVIEFEAMRKETQKSSFWKYSGEADLILLNVRKGESGQDAILDWSSAICCDLEKMKGDKAIASVRRFFEDTFRFADGYNGSDPVWDLSDQQGIKKVKSGLRSFILSFLPENLREFYSEAEHLAIRNISRAQPRPYLLSSLQANGDFIVVIEHLLQCVDEQPSIELSEDNLTTQLTNILEVADIQLDATLDENIDAIYNKPIVALRAAVAATKLARIASSDNQQKSAALNIFRRDILFAVTGRDKSLDQALIKRCLNDYPKIIYCLVCAMSDVASSTPASEKTEAIQSYSRLCSVVFS